MKTIVLKNTAKDGKELRATFMPDLGLNLMSYTKGEIEVIDQNTKADFVDRFAGLGPIIGPHFHHQKKEWIETGYDESLFPHIARVKKKGGEYLFSHGIARYVPWKYEATKNRITARLTGDDLYKGVKLSVFEGVDFQMDFRADLKSNGLEIEMSVESSRVCLSGLHYYYALSDKHGTVSSVVQDIYNDVGEFKPMPKEWCKADLHHLHFDLENAADYGFLPLKDHQGEILFKTKDHGLKIFYQGKDEQIAWQLYSPKDATFVCIEPMSAKNPRGLEAHSSSFLARIEIL